MLNQAVLHLLSKLHVIDHPIMSRAEARPREYETFEGGCHQSATLWSTEPSLWPKVLINSKGLKGGLYHW